ncbi:hypothetical protein AAHA92_20028 [Salvia divinorum]|uniref:Uncharacterized protein n=1 Tax=Salvia divinorum TaxID=28513 RepID=A0ABD1GFX0_SALDI
MALSLLMALLISSQVADARHLNRVSYKEGEKMIGIYARYQCPHRCCNVAAVADADAGARAPPRAAVASGPPPYCRCCL